MPRQSIRAGTKTKDNNQETQKDKKREHGTKRESSKTKERTTEYRFEKQKGWITRQKKVTNTMYPTSHLHPQEEYHKPIGRLFPYHDEVKDLENQGVDFWRPILQQRTTWRGGQWR